MWGWELKGNVLVVAGPYVYMPDLKALHALPLPGWVLPQELYSIDSPLSERWIAWREMLVAHSDQQFASYILDGLLHGFWIGFNRAHNLSPARHNTPSALKHSDVVERCLSREITKGRIIGPFSSQLPVPVQINRIGVVPKGHNSGEWRLITDLSFPSGASVNEGISQTLCSLQYTTVCKAA